MTSARIGLVFLLLLLVACGGGGGSKEVAPTYRIAGLVRGPVIEDVLITLSGSFSAETATDAGGNYQFSGLQAGTYSVTPSATGVTFVPFNRTFEITDADVSGMDFLSSGTAPPKEDVTPPTTPLRLVFVHHSCGGNWLDTGNGGLGDALGANNYYVRDVSYNWDAPNNIDIGSTTDIGHWWWWFADTTLQAGTARRDHICGELYITTNQDAVYTPIPDPGGENDVILFKSCYPNSHVLTDNGQPASALQGKGAGDLAHTLPNCQQIYRDILAYFQSQPNKLFVVVTAPPLVSSATFLEQAQNARTLNNWLVNTWLKDADWEQKNVAVFDFYNVITDPGNHHWVVSGVIEHINDQGDNFSAYGQGADSHPNQSGNVKARDEFIPILNAAYHRWQTWLGP